MMSLGLSSGITLAASSLIASIGLGFTPFGVLGAIGLGVAVIYGAYKLYKYLKKRRQ